MSVFLSKNIILPSCDCTLLKVCSSLAFFNVLILIAVKLSVTPIPVLFNFSLFLYILLQVLYLVNFTIIGRGLAFFEDLGWPSLCDLSISSDLIVSSILSCSVLMIFSSISSDISFHVLKGNCAVNIVSAYLLLHPFRQDFYLNRYFLFFKSLISSCVFFKSFSNSSNFLLIKLMALFMSLSCSVPLICQPLAARDIFFYTLHFCF